MSSSKENLADLYMTISENDVHASFKGKREQTKWNKIYCILILALASIIAVSIAITVVVVRNNEGNDDKTDWETNNVQLHNALPATTRDVCNSPDCVEAASGLLDSIDPKADPCNNFFQFACGMWRKKQVIPEEMSITSVFYHVEDSVNVILKYILEKEIEDGDIEAVKKAKKLYKSCLNLDAIEKDNFTSANRMIHELGGWPVLRPDWKEDTFNLIDLLSKTNLHTNNPPLIYMYVHDDSTNPTRNTLYIDQPQLGLPDREYFLRGRNDRKLVAYEKYAQEIAIIFGADAIAAFNDIKDIVDFEIEIANATMRADERHDDEKLYHKMTIGELQNRYPNFRWLPYFEATLGGVDLNISVDSSTTVINRNPDYMERIVNKLNTRSKRTVQNYVIWLTLKMMSDALPLRVRDAYGSYRETLIGSAVQPPRWQTCVGVVNSHMGSAVGKHFAQEAFDSQAKYKADEMIENLRSAMKDLLQKNEWMDTETIVKAIEKADKMQSGIGYSAKIKNDTFLNEKYKGHEFNETNYFDNVLLYSKLETKDNLQELPKPVDRSKWMMPPATVDAYYSPTKNQIMFPAGILQPPCYKNGYPQYLNYGGMGFVIGHEITHGFDDQGRQYDGAGNLKQWWSNASIINFKKRAECMVSQYSNYTVKEAGKKLNGKLTLGENIADNGGLKESWLAYERWLRSSRKGKPEPFLPGLDYTPKQLFFLSAAHVWCGLVRPEEAARRILTDGHSNYEARVNGPLQNNLEFSKAFNCPVGSYMNPKDKCIIW
uniref:Endothelin-converting enzyme 1 n=1 Tax=Magallana gigas TaxID=29159 RepID=A0A8W8JZP4_MAGGI|nr:neprilysin-1-like isoform X1 [Crassostrea gigas]